MSYPVARIITPTSNSTIWSVWSKFMAPASQTFIHISLLLSYPYLEIAHRPRYFLHFTISHKLDVRMVSYLAHLRSHDTLGAIERGESRVQLNHMPTD